MSTMRSLDFLSPALFQHCPFASSVSLHCSNSIFTTTVLKHRQASASLQQLSNKSTRIFQRPPSPHYYPHRQDPTMCTYTIVRFPCTHEIYGEWYDCNNQERGDYEWIDNPETYEPPINLLEWCSSPTTELMCFQDVEGRSIRCPKCGKCACGYKSCEQHVMSKEAEEMISAEWRRRFG